VRDWGIGILPEERERVFGESARGINVGLRAGSGLGLYIVKAIIHAHGGEISVAQTRGEGTTMKIELPIRWAAKQFVELRTGQA
jgi:signal transduction histidine kinase